MTLLPPKNILGWIVLIPALALAGCGPRSLAVISSDGQPPAALPSAPVTGTATAAPLSPSPTVRPSPTASSTPTSHPDSPAAPAITREAPTRTPDPASSPDPIDRVPEIDRMLTDLTRQGLFSGSVLVAQGEDILLRKGYGFADRSRQVPNTPATRFAIASMTKSFTAAAVLQLEEQGKIHLEDSVCAYLSPCPISWQEITVQQLLTHTAGIPDYANADSFAEIQDRDSTPDEIEAQFLNLSLLFSPGTRWSYSNSGYVLLGMIVERASGQSYEDYVRQHLLGPLGMANTGPNRDASSIAVGYSDSQNQARLIHLTSLFSAGELTSTTGDLFRWYRGLSGGDVISPDNASRMLSPNVPIQDGTGRSYGYGWYLSGPAEARQVSLGGRVSGFSSELVHFAAGDRLVVVLSNQANTQTEQISSKIAGMISP